MESGCDSARSWETFQGRTDELQAIGKALTGDSRPRVLTIHGTVGQGKTALAREVVERFAWAWPGGVVAVSLESVPLREVVATQIGRFLGVPTEQIADVGELEREVLRRLGLQRTLIVLDNAESLVQRGEAGDAEALRLVELLREKLPGPTVTLLVTSRDHLGWAGEMALELEGLPPRDGGRLFRQSAPQRQGDIDLATAEVLSGLRTIAIGRCSRQWIPACGTWPSHCGAC